MGGFGCDLLGYDKPTLSCGELHGRDFQGLVRLGRVSRVKAWYVSLSPKSRKRQGG